MYPITSVQVYVPFLYVQSKTKAGDDLIDSRYVLFGRVWQQPHHASTGLVPSRNLLDDRCHGS